MQFGPMDSYAYLFACLYNFILKLVLPNFRKPGTGNDYTFVLSASSLSISGTSAAGLMIIARSTGSGISWAEG